MSYARIAAIVAAALIWWGGEANAAGPLRAFRAGFWSGGAYTDDRTGSFTHCSAGVAYDSGINMFILVTDAGRWWLGFVDRQWAFAPQAKLPVALRFDGGPRAALVATIPNRQVVLVLLPDDERMIDRLRRSSELSLIADGQSDLFKLSGASAAMAELANCVQNRSRSRRVPRRRRRGPSPRPSPRSSRRLPCRPTIGRAPAETPPAGDSGAHGRRTTARERGRTGSAAWERHRAAGLSRCCVHQPGATRGDAAGTRFEGTRAPAGSAAGQGERRTGAGRGCAFGLHGDARGGICRARRAETAHRRRCTGIFAASSRRRAAPDDADRFRGSPAGAGFLYHGAAAERAPRRDRQAGGAGELHRRVAVGQCRRCGQDHPAGPRCQRHRHRLQSDRGRSADVQRGFRDGAIERHIRQRHGVQRRPVVHRGRRATHRAIFYYAAPPGRIRGICRGRQQQGRSRCRRRPTGRASTLFTRAAVRAAGNGG